MTEFWEILKASKGLSHEPFACLAAQSMAGGKVAELSGIPPLSFLSNGKPLVEYHINGKTVQNGTPTPESPIDIQGVGDLVESGEHAGQYAIPISSNGTTTATIYLDSPLYGTGDVLDEYDSTGKIVRKWGVLTLTGNENCYDYSYGSTNGVRVSSVFPVSYDRAQGYCNVYPVKTAAVTTHCLWIGGGGGDKNLYFVSVLDDMGLASTEDFKFYIASQYAAGTPVTVVYQLATPTEESISAPQINTVKGTNVLSVNTTVQPSSVSIKYKLK